MTRNSRILLQCITYCMLMRLAYTLIGDKVRAVKPGLFSFVVSISGKPLNDHIYGNHHICTGTLIKPRSVLTAAHCLIHKTYSEVEIIAGASNLVKGKRYFPESWITYDQWKKDHINNHLTSNDIALIILKGEGIQDVQPVNLWTIPETDLVNQTVRVLGWGDLPTGRQPFHLRNALLQVMSNEKCSDEGTKLKGNHFYVPPNYFCSKANPWAVSSNGDGGAPVLTKGGYLIGINIGTCPKLAGNYSTDFLNEHLLNSHLRLHYYGHFLLDVPK